MKKEFFHQQMKLLMDNFGTVEYTPARIDIIWDHCKDLPDYNFGRIIRHFLETKSVKYPPLPTHFHEAALEQRKMIEQLGGAKRIYSGDEPGYSNTPIEKIMEKLGGSNAVEALENQIKKQKEQGDCL